ncbi:MAG: histidine--tRNA ligase [Candidatus Babeliales bacterium]
MVRRVKGTQDFIHLNAFNATIEAIRTHLQRCHFQEIATPIIEYSELFNRSLGTETDIVNKEMFYIQNKTEENEHQLCLRPEGTAPIMRAFLEHTITQHPWHVFSIGPMFRYERPQKGRYRQFHQVTIESIKALSHNHDSDLLVTLDRLFQRVFHLDDYALIINFLGCKKDRLSYKEHLVSFLDSIADQLCSTCQMRRHTNTLRVLDCKKTSCITLYHNAPQITAFLCTSCAEEWEIIQKNLTILGVSFVIKSTLVRGLDYYTKTIFEFVSHHLGAQSAFCGGGRYDHLSQELGAAEAHPSIGAAIGIERLLMLLHSNGNFLEQNKPKPSLITIIPFGETKEHTIALMLADLLRSHHHTTTILFDGKSLKSMMRQANKMEATHVLIIGSEEQEKQTVTIKYMLTGATETVPQYKILDYLT